VQNVTRSSAFGPPKFRADAPGMCLGAQGLLVVERQVGRSAPAERWVPAVEGWELSKG
jgi:hypothetical protein